MSCTHVADYEVDRAFYHWQTDLDISEAEADFLVKVSSTRIYAKCFDLDYNAARRAVEPSALIRIGSLPANTELVPVIFITNRSFLNTDADGAGDLAKFTHELLERQLGERTFPAEVQFDCDWSPQTRDRFFEFLRAMRELLPEGTRLSSTIRLHQFRYPERTGVPPVDRGALMVYNVGEVDEVTERNSILTPELASAYLRDAPDYPLPLDVALPIFRWGVVYRHGRLIRLINNLDRSELADTSRFEPVDPYLFRLKRSQYLRGQYFYRNDLIRPEAVAPETLFTVAEELSAKLPSQSRSVIFYHLDTTTIQYYAPSQLDSLYRIF